MCFRVSTNELLIINLWRNKSIKIKAVGSGLESFVQAPSLFSQLISQIWQLVLVIRVKVISVLNSMEKGARRRKA